MQSFYDLLKRIARRVDPARVEQFLAYSIIERAYARYLENGNLVARREQLWDDLIMKVGPNHEILYLEFGVFEGYSIRYFSERLSHPNSKFVGFDSFEGLPERWEGKSKGYFSTRGKVPSITDERVSFRKGWFSETLPIFLTEFGNKHSVESSPPVIVHFDADLYSSTLYALATLHPHFRRYFFCFDEFTGHESRALYNYEQAFGAVSRFFMMTGERWRPLQLTGEIVTN